MEGEGAGVIRDDSANAGTNHVDFAVVEFQFAPKRYFYTHN
jgi:hypothetical protein